MREREGHAFGGREAVLAVEDHAVTAVEHDDGGAGALVLALGDHQIRIVDVNGDPLARAGPGIRGRGEPALGMQALNGAENRAARVDVQRVAELVPF